jgi:hypothetical protein
MLLSGFTPSEQISVLEEDLKISFADSEPTMLESAGSSSGHVNSSFIEAAMDGWIISGDTRNNMQFGPLNLAATSSQNGGNDADSYIAKIDSDGNWMWATMPDATAGLIFLDAMTTDTNGDIYIGGLIWGQVDFGSTILTTSNGGGDGFVAKLDPQGNWLWATAFSTTPESNGSSWVRGLAFDATGNSNGIIASGSQSGITTFGTHQLNNTDIEYLVVSIDPFTGLVNWVESAGGLGTDIGYDIGVDSNGNIWQVGVTSGTFTANGQSHQAVSQQDTVVVKWTPVFNNGAQVSIVKGIASNSGMLSIPDDLVVTSTNDVVVAGVFIGTLDAGNQKTVTDQGSNGDAFVVKIGSNGATSWITSAGSGGQLDWATSVRENKDGDYVVGGQYSGTASFDGNYITSAGSGDGFIAQLDNMGNWDWVESIGGPDYDIFSDVAVNDTGNYSGTGSYQSTINKGTQSITSSGGLDIFIWAIDPAQNADRDNDGVNDQEDNCPDDNNPLQIDSDLDSDGDECDYDDDNDGITDNNGDDCPRGGSWNWTSNQNTDFDNDGCKDDSPEDLDDDNDGVLDVDDSCLTSYTPPRGWWTSDSGNDVDGDGCRDSDEDLNDDNDEFDDASDDCSKEYGTSNLGSYNGCLDRDGDGYADVEDSCPLTAGDSTFGGSLGCPDSDGDGWQDTQDDLPNDSSQWEDYDGDGFGDNPDGNNSDDCINIPGESVLDRYGCPDQDDDGYSTADDNWLISDGADAFPLDQTQWSDWDEDGFGDNYGNLSWEDRPSQWPGEYYSYAQNQDACPTLAGDSWKEDIFGCPDSDSDGWADSMDAFPGDPNEYRDSDGDSYADGNDGCPNLAGNSTEDRKGCGDFDSDGWSDPEVGIWDVSDGADWAPLDPTQWSNQDGDNYGDNMFGTLADQCPEEFGTSFMMDHYGCIDSDGDGWADVMDAFPDQMTQWNDTDGDGFGDNFNGLNPDECPLVAGVEKENGCEEVIEEASSISTTVLVAGGGGILLVIGLIVGLVLMRRSNDDSEKSWGGAPTMPDMSAQPAGQQFYQQPVQNTQPAYSQPVQQTYTQPVQQTIPQTNNQQDNGRTEYQQVQPVLMPTPSAAPAAPSVDMVGSMRSDNNEWLEYPAGAGAWYMRDQTSRQWIRKI